MEQRLNYPRLAPEATRAMAAAIASDRLSLGTLERRLRRARMSLENKETSA